MGSEVSRESIFMTMSCAEAGLRVALLQINMEVDRGSFEDDYPLYRAFCVLPF